MGLRNTDPKPFDFLGNIPSSAVRIVGQKQKRDVLRLQIGDESVRALDQLSTSVNHTIHIDQVSWHRRLSLVVLEFKALLQKLIA
jgi:hypothetical protein